MLYLPYFQQPFRLPCSTDAHRETMHSGLQWGEKGDFVICVIYSYMEDSFSAFPCSWCWCLKLWDPPVPRVPPAHPHPAVAQEDSSSSGLCNRDSNLGTTT